MKLNKILAGIISGVIAAASMATSASAYLSVPASPASLLTTNNQSWSKMINSSYDIDYSELAQIQAAFTLTDPAAYETEKAVSDKKKILLDSDSSLAQVSNAAEVLGYELSDSDKLVVARARKIQRFLSQPFSVASQFTGMEGKYLPIKETVRGFKEILEGKHDEIPEQMFLMAGGIDEVVEKFENSKNIKSHL